MHLLCVEKPSPKCTTLLSDVLLQMQTSPAPLRHRQQQQRLPHLQQQKPQKQQQQQMALRQPQALQQQAGAAAEPQALDGTHLGLLTSSQQQQYQPHMMNKRQQQ